MKQKQAIRLAIESIDKEIQRLAFDANLYEKYNAPHGARAWQKRKKLLMAREIFIGIQISILDKQAMEVCHSQAQMEFLTNSS